MFGFELHKTHRKRTLKGISRRRRKLNIEIKVKELTNINVLFFVMMTIV
jgi:hypothetical protein